MFRIDAVRLYRLSGSGDSRVGRLQRVLAQPQAVLSTILLCNTAVNVSTATIIAAALLSRYEAVWSSYRIELTATITSTLLILFWGEILPKTLAARNPSTLALALARPISTLMTVVRPATLVFEAISNGLLKAFGGMPVAEPFRVTPETLEVAVDLGLDQGAFEDEERTMIRGLLETGETKVREIMTPRPDVARLPATATAAAAADIILSTGFSRLPVYGSNIDDIVGIIYVKDLLPLLQAGSLDRPVGQVARPPYIVPETKLVSDLLHEMKERGEAMAVVVDEYGGTSGVVTLEDVVEEIVGDISDEFDQLELATAKTPGGYIFSGRMLIEDANDEYGLDLPVAEDVDTLAGLIYSIAGEVPLLGDTVDAGNWLLTVEELRGSRIIRVRAQRPHQDGDEPDGTDDQSDLELPANGR